MRSGAMIAGAAPTHMRREPHGHGLRVLDGRDRHLLLQSRAAIAARRAVDLDHAFVAVRPKASARATADVPPVIFTTSPGSRADAQQVGRREPRDGVADVLDARFRNAQRDGGRERGWSDFRHCAT